MRAFVNENYRTPERLRAARGAVYLLATATVLAVLIEVWVPRFYHLDNITNVLRQAGILGIVTLGQCLVLLVAGIDLSVGAVMSASLVVVAELSRPGGLGLFSTLVVVLLLGAFVGSMNGLLVAYRGVPPFIATLAMTAVVGGAQLAYTKGVPAGAIPESLRPLGLTGIGRLPYATILWMVLAFVLFILLRRTAAGRHLYAAGTSRAVAVRSGTRTELVVLAAYIGCGLLAAVAGIVLSAYVGYVDPGIGTGYELDSISAAVVGGVAFTGGRGGVLGASLGVLFLSILLNLVILAGINPNLQLVVRGGVVIGAMAVIAVRANQRYYHGRA